MKIGPILAKLSQNKSALLFSESWSNKARAVIKADDKLQQ